MRPALLFVLLISGVVQNAHAQQLKKITNSIGMNLVLIIPGSFTMGSPNEEFVRKNIETQHEVTISNWLYVGAYEVTQDEYEKVMGANPSRFKGSKRPVEMVSWNDAVRFCKKLSEMPEEKSAGREYRLPTAAEWEYACRAGSTTLYHFGDTSESLGEYAWFGAGPLGKTHPVGEKKPNRWGLYDMSGNVFEWCQDWYANYPSGAAIDPKGPSEGSNKVIRGGCWYTDAESCRSAFQTKTSPLDGDYYVGFRVAMSPPVKQPAQEPSK